MTTTLNILLLEDEQQAKEKIIDLIREQAPLARVEWKRSIKEGQAFLSQDPPLDLIFSDIELLDGNVIQLYQEIQPKCPIIFCTAYNDYYLQAFRTNGIAYLLKPYPSRNFNPFGQNISNYLGSNYQKICWSNLKSCCTYLPSSIRINIPCVNQMVSLF